MRESKYNYFFQKDDLVLAYNGRTNALAEVSLEDYEKIKKYLSNEDDIDKDLKESLVYGGFLLEEDIDELELIRNSLLMSRYSTDFLGLTIAPTSNCNFRCPYCYEKDVLRPSNMSDEVADGIIRLIDSRLSTINNLSITWYGGEPLLQFDRIKDLSQKVLERCKDYGVIYTAGMVTNGYLLTSEVFEELMNLNVKSLQITLDGTKEVHDSKRYLKGYGGTFDTIVNNILSLEDICMKTENLNKIGIRINVDKSNIDSAFELLDYISNSRMKNYVFPHIAAVNDPTDTYNEKTFSNEEYFDVKCKFEEQYRKKGFGTNYNYYYPTRINTICGCDRMSSLVVDSDGRIYKCWEEVGQYENSIGDILDPKDKGNINRYLSYMLFDPTMDGQCSTCKTLPNCMGGCPLRRNNSGGKMECSIYKSKMEEMIIKSYGLL